MKVMNLTIIKFLFKRSFIFVKQFKKKIANERVRHCFCSLKSGWKNWLNCDRSKRLKITWDSEGKRYNQQKNINETRYENRFMRFWIIFYLNFSFILLKFEKQIKGPSRF